MDYALRDSVPIPTLLTSADAALRLRKTPDRIRQIARSGALPASAVTPGGQRLFTLAAVELYMHDHPSEPGR